MKQINKDKPERHFISVLNHETVSIAKGTPVVYVMDATDDGLAIQKPSSGTAVNGDFLLAGVAAQDISASDYGLVQVFGITPMDVTLRVQTRANSTQSVASTAAIAVGAALMVDTVNNCFYAPASVGVATQYGVKAVLCETDAGVTASIVGTDIASSGADSGWYSLTVSTAAVKAFLRCM